MKQELKDRWIKALESGDYKKGRGALCRRNDAMCCLGVLADIEGKLSDKSDSVGNRYFLLGEADNTAYLPDGQFGISYDLQIQLASLNDTSKTFAPVIEYIKENVEVTS